MRGKVSTLVLMLYRVRITPAYAGKRLYAAERDANGKDHPRLCGEKVRNRKGLILCQGSPPPMRGKVEIQAVMGSCIRITPAYAGKRIWI